MSTTKANPQPKVKSTGRVKSIVKGDVVLLSHKRIGVVRYVGDIAEYIEKCIWYGIEIRMTAGLLGDSNGIIGTTQYFKCATNEGLFVKLPEIQRRIEPKELLEKVVKLTKIKNSIHQLLNQTHNELTSLKKKFNLSPSNHTHSSSKYDYQFTKNKKKRRPNSRKNSSKNNLKFENHNSGSITYEPSISISDSLNIYDNNNNEISESDNTINSINSINSAPFPPIKVATPMKLLQNYNSIEQWDNKKTCNWIKSIGINNCHNIIKKFEDFNINGNDLINMNETDLLNKKLDIKSKAIQQKIINALEIEKEKYKNNKKNINNGNALELKNSLSSPTHTKTAKVNNGNNNNKPFLKYKRLSYSNSSPNKYVYDCDIDDAKDSKNNGKMNKKLPLFPELYTFYKKMHFSNSNNNSMLDLNSFRYLLVEMDPDLKPYKLTNDAIKKCFDQFDLIKNGYITIEEFIIIMGKTYLRGKAKSKTQLTKTDINQYFIQMIKHFLKKQQKNINYNQKQTRKESMSRSRTVSGSNFKPRPPPRKRSLSKSKKNGRPPPPKRDASPSRSSGGNY